MAKKLTARVQKLNPVLKEQESGFSFGVVLEPDSRDISISKGNVYALFDISAEHKIDASLVQKIIQDVLQNTYYTSDNSSPVQSLEKSISKVRDNIFDLVQENSLVNTTVEFNAIGSILWGNVLYVVQYGKGSSYLMHDNDINTIQTSGEGSFQSSSGIVKEDDVVILCTEGFARKFPPKKLLTIAMSGKDLSAHDSCLLLKLIEDASFSGVDMDSLTPSPSFKKQKFELLLEAIVTRIQLLGNKKKEKSLLVVAKPKVNLKNTLSLNKKYGIILAYLLIISSVAFGVYSSFKYKDSLPKFNFKKQKETKSETFTALDSATSVTTEVTKPVADDLSKDEGTKTYRVTVNQTLYDLIITDLNLKPTEIEIFDNKLIVSDSSSGKIYTSILGDYKFLPIEETFVGISNLAINKEGSLTFGDNGGIKVYDLTSLDLKEQFTSKYSGGLGVFEDFIYTFDKSSLIKYTRDTDKLTSSVWGESTDFLDARNINIAYSVYLTTKDNKLVKYTTGKKDDFEVKNLDVPFGNMVDLVAKEDFKHLYIADKDNSRIVVLDLAGNFVKQFKYTNSAEWGDLKSIAVSSDEKMLYVLNGTKVYEISL